MIFGRSNWRILLGDLHSTKTFENLEAGQAAANGSKISRRSFQKFQKLFNFRNTNHFTENSRNSGNKMKWKENFREKFFKKLGITREVVLLFGNFGKCCSFRFWKLPENLNQTFWLNGKRQIINNRLFCIKKSIRIKVYVRVFLGLRTMHKWYT